MKSASETSFEYSYKELPSSILEHRFAMAVVDTASLLDKLPLDLNYYLVVNKKRHGDASILGWGNALSGDLFENAPKEIREKDSLFIGKWDLTESNAEAITQILASDSMILLLSDLDLPTLMEKQKIAWAWFSRPTILHQQLVHGSETLAKTLFAGIKFAMLVDRSTTDILIFGFSPLSIDSLPLRPACSRNSLAISDHST